MKPTILADKLLLSALSIVIFTKIWQFVIMTISDKNDKKTIFSQQSSREILELLKDTQSFPFTLTQCCAKPEKTMPEIANHE